MDVLATKTLLPALVLACLGQSARAQYAPAPPPPPNPCIAKEAEDADDADDVCSYAENMFRRWKCGYASQLKESAETYLKDKGVTVVGDKNVSDFASDAGQQLETNMVPTLVNTFNGFLSDGKVTLPDGRVVDADGAEYCSSTSEKRMQKNCDKVNLPLESAAMGLSPNRLLWITSMVTAVALSYFAFQRSR